MSSEYSRKNKYKSQDIFNKYRKKLAMAATVLTLATPAAIQIVQEGEFNPLATIQAVSSQDVSKEIKTVNLALINQDGTLITPGEEINPYGAYQLRVTTRSKINIGKNQITAGDYFYIDVPEELDYAQVLETVDYDIPGFKYTVTKDGANRLCVEIKEIIKLDVNMMYCEMELPVTIPDKTDREIELVAKTTGGQSPSQKFQIKGRDAKDISDTTEIAMTVYQPNDNQPIANNSTVKAHDVLGFEFSLKLPAETVQPGDSFVVNLPKQMEYVDGSGVNMTALGAQVVGTIDNQEKTMTCSVLQVPKGVEQLEALKVQLKAPFEYEIIKNGGSVSLVASTAKNTVTHNLQVSTSEKADITEKVAKLALGLSQLDDTPIADNAIIDPYSAYNMKISVDMGTNYYANQVKPGDYLFVNLPNEMDYDYLGELVYETKDFKFRGNVVRNEKESINQLRIDIEKVPRAEANTVAFEFNVALPFNLEEVKKISPNGNDTRKVTLTLSKPEKTTCHASKTIQLDYIEQNDVDPTGDEYIPALPQLFSEKGMPVLYKYYQTGEFSNSYHEEYRHYLYTLIKLDKHKGLLGWNPKWDTLGKNVDSTRRHWSARPPKTSAPSFVYNQNYNNPNHESISNSLPNAGPENFIVAYCIEDEAMYTFGGSAGLSLNRKKNRYNLQNLDEYKYNGKLIPEATRNELKDILAHAYPFVSEQEMRNYYDLPNEVRLSDIISGTQERIWNILGITNNKYLEYAKLDDNSCLSTYQGSKNILPSINWGLSAEERTIKKDDPSRVRKVIAKIAAKQNNKPAKTDKPDVVIESFTENNDTVTVTLSRALDDSETGSIIITLNGKSQTVLLTGKADTVYEIPMPDTASGTGQVVLEVTDTDDKVEYFAMQSVPSQDVITSKITPRKYLDQKVIEFNTGKFEFVKISKDADTASIYTIAGAEFTLTHNKTGEVFTAIADENGQVTYHNLPDGEYTLVETTAPDGYLLINTPHKVKVNNGKGELLGQDIKADPWKDKYELHNPEVLIKLIKHTAGNQETRLAGAVFEINKTTGPIDGKLEGFPKQYMTDANGEFSAHRLTNGTYTITEITAPDGYQKSDKVIEFTAENGVVTRTDCNPDKQLNPVDAKLGTVTNEPIFVSNKPIGGLTIRKQDSADATKFLPGAEFTLTNLTTQEIVATVETPKSGELTFSDLTEGYYSLQETKAPADYVGSDKKWYFYVDSNGRTYQAFNAEAADSNSGSDVQRAAPFYDGAGHSVNTASKIIDINKEEGTYTQYIYINNYEKYPIWFYNKHFKPTAKITLPKFNTKDTVKYKIHKVPANQVITDLQRFNGVDINTYPAFPKNTITTSVNQGTDKTEMMVEFHQALSAKNNISEANAAIIEVTAKYRDGFEEVSNLDVTSTFEYSPKANSKDKNSATTHNTATIVNYSKANDQEITEPIIITNEKYHDLQVIKKNKAGTGLKNAEFILTKKDDPSFEQKKNSGDNGLISFDKLEAGEYILSEKIAPEGYIETPKQWHINVTDQGIIRYTPITDKEYMDSGADFVRDYPANGYGAYYLNLASKIMAVDTENKTFTQYIYVNNYLHKYNNHTNIFFDKKGFAPKVILELPKGNAKTDIKYEIYNVPQNRVGELTKFDLDLSTAKFKKLTGTSQAVSEGLDSLSTLQISFGETLNAKNAAIIKVTAKYNGDAITTKNTFQYHDINYSSNEKWNLRTVSTINQAYTYSKEEKEGAIITKPIDIVNDKKPRPKPRPCKGRVGIKKSVLGGNPTGAEFTLFKGRLEALGESVGMVKAEDDSEGIIVFDDILPGVYTLKETKAPDGAIATDRTWTIIVANDGYTQAFENPTDGGSPVLPAGGKNQGEHMEINNQSFTISPYGTSKEYGTNQNETSTIYPNNGGLMKLSFGAAFDPTIKPLAGDYFIVDIPDYMHDHGINPSGVNQHILENVNDEPIAIGKMVDIVEIDGKDFEVLTKEGGQRYYLVDSAEKGKAPVETSLGETSTNRVIKYTFTKYAPRMDHIKLFGNLNLSIDTEKVKNDEQDKPITYSIAGKGYLGNPETKPAEFNAGKLTISYPKGRNNGVVNINSCINYKDNKNEKFEYYIYLNKDDIQGYGNTKLAIYDYKVAPDDTILIKGTDSAAKITSIELYNATDKELPDSFGIRNNLASYEKVGDNHMKSAGTSVEYPDSNRYTIDLGNKLKNGDSYIVKVSGDIDRQGAYLALSARVTSEDKPNDFLNAQNWTYLRSSQGAITGQIDVGYPILKVANMKKNNALKVTKIQEDGTSIEKDKIARFGISKKPNPTDDNASNQDIYNGQVAWLNHDNSYSFTFTNGTGGKEGPGFEPGQYYLWEVKAPMGYQKLIDTVPFYIKEDGTLIIPSKEVLDKEGRVIDHVLDKEHPAFEMIDQPKLDETAKETIPVFEIKVKNRKAEYPETGSIGSMMFYMIGLTSMIGSALVFTKKQ